ncbi:MAG TPA: hypothetical protein DCX07_12150 [Phycisphaerales bacterium]|nr:hypothetical protein [Phycisphaerales bacterium]
MRIQKLLSEMGVASRRAVEQMILDGRISVNGRPVVTMPCMVEPDCDEIRVDGVAVIRRSSRKVYFLLNKPRGVVCTQNDPEGRPLATDLVPAGRERLYCVGRLDVENTGLILLTNDGELTQYLTHPRYGVTKTYRVEIDGRPTEQQIAQVKRGMYLDGRKTGGAAVKVLRAGHERSLLEVRLAEGRNREIRRILAKLGHKVRRLHRSAIGPVTDKGLKIGNFRPLLPGEVKSLRRCGSGAMEM